MLVAMNEPHPLNGPRTLLTPKQERYCQLAATDSYDAAYRAAYDCKPFAVVRQSINELNRNPAIARRIAEIQGETNKSIKYSREWLIGWWFGRMVYDPAELTAWSVGACRYCHGDGHGYQWRMHEYLNALAEAEAVHAALPDIAGGFGYNSVAPPHCDCPNCDGKGIGRTDLTDTHRLSAAARAAFDGIEQTKDGIKIKMADKHAAAAAFAKLTGYDVPTLKIITAEVPEDEELQKLATDPIALMAWYKTSLGTVQ